MTKSKTTLPDLRNFLIDWTTDELGRDARFIAPQIRIRQREGTPNWDANIEISAPAVVSAFGRAVHRLQQECDVTW